MSDIVEGLRRRASYNVSDGVPPNQLLSDAADEIERLQSAIRRHRDYRGDDRCFLDDEELYSVLPEGYTAPERDVAVELENCKRFIECRHNPKTAYVSPQRRIEELEQIVQAIHWCR